VVALNPRSKLLVLLDRSLDASIINSCRFCACGVDVSMLYLTGLTLVDMGGGVIKVGDCKLHLALGSSTSAHDSPTLVGSLGGGLMTSGGRSAGFAPSIGSVPFYSMVSTAFAAVCPRHGRRTHDWKLSGAWMTETASSLWLWRMWSGILVFSILSWTALAFLAMAGTAEGATCGCGPKLLIDWSSVTSSSSISVVSVPLDVTGDGPTMSLEGLMRWPECALRKD
jgi:hypothetical protein